MKLSEPMRLMLLNLLEGRSPKAHCHGQAAHGGAEGTMRALVNRGLMTWELELTGDGRTEAERIRGKGKR